MEISKFNQVNDALGKIVALFELICVIKAIVSKPDIEIVVPRRRADTDNYNF